MWNILDTDYDTYYQITGGSFSDYLSFLVDNELLKLEDFSLRNKSELPIDEENKELIDAEVIKKEPKKEITKMDIIVFTLEILACRYGVFEESEDFDTKSYKEKLEELFEFYESVGISRESAIEIAKRALSYRNRERKRKK